MAISDEQFEELALAPKRTRTDEGTVEERSIDDLIKARNATAQQTVTGVPWGMKIAMSKPPGTV